MRAFRRPPAEASAAGPFTEFDARRLDPIRTYLVRHPAVMDVVVATLFLIPSSVNAVLIALGHAEAPEWSGWVLVGIALAAFAVLLRRRREPVLIAGAITVLGVVAIAITGDSGSLELAAAFTMYAVASSRRPSVAWVTLGVQALTLISAAALFLDKTPGGSSRPVELDASTSPAPFSTVLVLGQLIALGIGTGVRSRREHIANLIDRANALARDRERQSQLAAAAERARIAREMHDVVAHSLTVMVALAEGVRAAANDPPLAEVALDALTETGRSALDDMRRVLGVLRDPDAEVPFAPERAVGLDDLMARFRAAGLPVRLVLRGDVPAGAVPARDAADRIVQEALTNALRYAPDTSAIMVEVSRRDERRRGGGDWLDVNVIDAGPPAGATRPAGVGTGRGIIGMRERAAVHGGSVTAGPEGSGWRVHATLRLDLDPKEIP
ncbi:sensor histidine kinase [Agromyces larvae]|uniref:histidine kinase n=1 Tax=Agromyces larvae TaxID=2929802 RepID=A0ABY4BXT9_9MICO|nr:sensor histidine kinase [Agromyces larvae]UOE44048.1 histidine kinase [Agromyces larvae]